MELNLCNGVVKKLDTSVFEAPQLRLSLTPLFTPFITLTLKRSGCNFLRILINHGAAINLKTSNPFYIIIQPYIYCFYVSSATEL